MLKLTTILLLLLLQTTLHGQRVIDSLTGIRVMDINQQSRWKGDTLLLRSGICKPLKYTALSGTDADIFNSVAKKAKPFLKIHGNIQYDFTYRSFIDTPFVQSDFSQHTVQTTLNFIVKERYPLQMTLLHRNSNSPYFDDITDVSIRFDRNVFINQLKRELEESLAQKVNNSKVADIEKLWKQKKWEIEALNSWLNSPGRMQEFIEAKEQQTASRLVATGGAIDDALKNSHSFLPGKEFLRNKLHDLLEKRWEEYQEAVKKKEDSVLANVNEKADSSKQTGIMKKYQQKRQEMDSALQVFKQYEKQLLSAKKNIQDSLGALKAQLARINDPAALKRFMQENKLNAKQLPNGWKALTTIQSIGIGRSWVDYTDLTVKNISLTGINAEFNPGRFYFAFAAGKINYRFRDFIVKDNGSGKQTLYLLRAGAGKKESNNIIFTWYDGKRNMIAPSGTGIVNNRLERVIGISIQSRLQLDDNNFIILESAKSSFTTARTANQPEEKLMGKVLNFKDRTNEAYSIKVNSYLPNPGTRITGYYRKMGVRFQSFNLQPVNVQQEAYQLKVQQQLWNRRLQLEAAIRKNDFNSPFINPGLTSKTVFKSVQATLRVPKYPFVSVGYYPSSQLTLMDNNVLVENQYNTLSVVMGHSYRLKGFGMSTNAVLLRFYNSGADTGFIYYNAKSVALNHFIFLERLQLQSGLSFTSQHNLKLITLEQSASFQCRDWLLFSGGLKLNRVYQRETLVGMNAGAGVIIKKMGTIQISYDKSYLPGTARNLLPVNMGKLTYYRTF